MHKNEKLVIEMYQNNKLLGIKTIGRQLNMCPKTIKKIFKRNDIKLKPASFTSRTYDVNDNFLDKIEKEQAYFLGWIASDGCVGKNNEIRIHLQDRDLDVIEKLKELLDFDGPIHFLDIKGKPRNNLIPTMNAYQIAIANERLANKLRSFNLNENKSYSLTFPSFLKMSLIPHFLRSFIEGDGSIVYVKNKNNLYVSFVSTNEFCNGCKQFIEKELNIGVYLEPLRYNFNKEKVTSKTHLRFVINGNCNSLIFLNYIYKNPFLFMNRKYEYFKNVIGILDGRPRCQKKTKEQITIAKNIIQNAEY